MSGASPFSQDLTHAAKFITDAVPSGPPASFALSGAVIVKSWKSLSPGQPRPPGGSLACPVIVTTVAVTKAPHLYPVPSQSTVVPEVVESEVDQLWGVSKTRITRKGQNSRLGEASLDTQGQDVFEV